MRETDGPDPGASPAAGARAHPPPRDRTFTPTEDSGPSRGDLARLAFAALGIVYGDIGTSPLYALRACFDVESGGVAPTPANVLGVLSLVSWSLILVVSVKYITFILRADNRGEGGILALMAGALPPRPKSGPAGSPGLRPALLVMGLFGAALLYGDGMITPAITVLGAVEGLGEATPALAPIVVPASVAILLGVFLLQRRGTAGVAAIFSPVTLIWFAAIAALGLVQLAGDPRVLAAADPRHAVRFLAEGGFRGFLTMGFVFLAVTGGEALYADMGHFGRRPIRLAWWGIVLPALLLNYFGQGALLLADPRAAENPFYRIVPGPLLLPMIVVATGAAIVASQALISGAFSLSRQAVQLGYLPRLRIVHTSGSTEGQIYVPPAVNWALMAGTIGLVLAFRGSGALAAAYGIAVSATMAITTVLFYVFARERFGWNRSFALLLASAFLILDLVFLAANGVKIQQGGWFPIVLALGIYLLMTTWHAGREDLSAIGRRSSLPLDLLLSDLDRRCVTRVPGTAVFMSNAEPGEVPLVLLHHLKHNQVLQERVVLLTVLGDEVPTIPEAGRVTTVRRESGFYEVSARYGFMETPDVPGALSRSEPLRDSLELADVTYYLGRQTLIPKPGSGMALWRKKLFRFMARNALRPTAYFRLPANRVVELGAQVQF